MTILITREVLSKGHYMNTLEMVLSNQINREGEIWMRGCS